MPLEESAAARPSKTRNPHLASGAWCPLNGAGCPLKNLALDELQTTSRGGDAFVEGRDDDGAALALDHRRLRLGRLCAAATNDRIPHVCRDQAENQASQRPDQGRVAPARRVGSHRNRGLNHPALLDVLCK